MESLPCAQTSVCTQALSSPKWSPLGASPPAVSPPLDSPTGPLATDLLCCQGSYPGSQRRGHCGPWRQQVAHFGDDKVGHQLFVLFHVLSNQGHGTVHHLLGHSEG